MAINPIDPSKKTGGNGSEKYTPNEKRGPSEYDKAAEKVKQENEKARAEISKMAEKTRAEPPYTGKAYSDTGPRTGPTISGTFGLVTDPMERKAKPYNKAKGGVIKSASKRADGCCIRGKTRA
jgi:hypothetical protein